MISERLQELRQELQSGQQQMTVLDQRRQELRDTMLRISGAIQVLEEIISKNEPDLGAVAAAEVPS